MPTESFFPTTLMYQQNTYIKDNFFDSEILYRHGASKAAQV